ncbi:transporter YfdV [Escherichia coli]|uniref:Transporter YfdV n=1 Tax=Escherichia coli TaxID=562 RepID=A0A377K2Y8_ECOLX|nr:transporter YfdV [Escherichia coli]
MAVFAAGLTLAAHKFEFSAEIAYNTFLKLILDATGAASRSMACHLNSEHLQMMVLGRRITAGILRNHYCQPVLMSTPALVQRHWL